MIDPLELKGKAEKAVLIGLITDQLLRALHRRMFRYL